MLTIEGFRNGFQANLTQDYARYLLSDDTAIGTDDPFERAGVVSAIHDAFPELDAWQDEPAKSYLAELSAEPFIAGVPEGPEGNGYYAARFSVAGLVPDLVELVRRAKHRDGSTAAIQTSSAALSLLSAAAEGRADIALSLSSLGLDLSNIKFGNHPAGALPVPYFTPGVDPVLNLNAPEAGASTAEVTVRVRRAANPVPAAAREFPPEPAAAATPQLAGPYDSSVFADVGAGTVQVGGLHLSITKALALVDGLVSATRRLLLPAEGCQWVNDQTDPLKFSSLVVLDSYLAAGLPVFPGGGALLAEITQSEQDGLYRVKVYDRTGGSSQFGESSDMNDAKFLTAERVRPELQKLLG
jgi:hypothetical protein